VSINFEGRGPGESSVLCGNEGGKVRKVRVKTSDSNLFEKVNIRLPMCSPFRHGPEQRHGRFAVVGCFPGGFIVLLLFASPYEAQYGENPVEKFPREYLVYDVESSIGRLKRGYNRGRSKNFTYQLTIAASDSNRSNSLCHQLVISGALRSYLLRWMM
jgi:hypothetical protein